MEKEVGEITNLFVKTRHGAPMTSRQTMTLQVGHGIEVDINAQAMSPRQILLVRQEDIDALNITPGDLRENIVVSGLSAELFVPGAVFRPGNTAQIRATFFCEACKRIAHAVPSFESIAEKRGILGVVVSNGSLEIGARVTVSQGEFPPLSAIPYHRFLDFVARIPTGRVVTYRQIIIGMGVTESYMRAIPTYIKRTSAEHYPLHRILATTGKLIPYAPNQQRLLGIENVRTVQAASSCDTPTDAYVSLNEYLWHDPTIYLS